MTKLGRELKKKIHPLERCKGLPGYAFQEEFKIQSLLRQTYLASPERKPWSGENKRLGTLGVLVSFYHQISK